MKIIIPTAGRGTRLLPHTLTKPKQLIDVAGKAVLGHIIDEFAGLPISEHIFVVGYMREQIEQYVRDNYSFPTRFVEQVEPKGQAQAILLCRDLVDGPVLIVFSDTLTDADLSGLPQESADAVIYVKEVEDPRRFGAVALDGQGFITRFVEKPSSLDNRLVVIGMYYVKDSQLLMQCCQELMDRDIQTKGEYYLADAFNLMIQEHGAKFRPQAVETWEDCGKPETLLQTNRYLLSHGHSNAEQVQTINSVLIPPVHVALTAKVEDSVIGPYVNVGEGAIVRHSIIRDSLIDAGATILEAMLDQSLVGKDAFVRENLRRLNVGDASRIDFGDICE